MFEIILLTIQIVALLFFIGYGFTALLIPKNLRTEAVWLTPWFGTILIVLISVIFSLAKIPVSGSAYIIISFSSVLLITSLIMQKTISIFTKENLLITLLVIFTLLFNLFPLLTRVGFRTTISLGNLDPLSYTPVGDFLVHHTVFEGGTFEHYKPYLWATGDLIHAGFRWGPPLILSFFAHIFGLKSYQIYSLLITIFFVLTFPLVYILAKRLSKNGNLNLLFFVFITFALNSTLLYMLYNVFYAQFIFAGIFILIIILFQAYISVEKENLIRFNSYDLFIALGLSALTTSYAEGLIFVVLPFLVYGFLSVLRRRNIIPGIYILKILLLTIIINPVTFGTAAVQNIKTIVSSAKTAWIGWEHIPYAAPLEMMGFYNLYHYKELPFLLDIIFSLPIVVIWFLGFKNSHKKLFISSLIVAWIPFYIGLRWVIPNFFSYHRIITYTLFLYSILFSIGISSLFSKLKSKPLELLLIAFFLLLTFRSSLRTLYQFYWHAQVVDKSLISLNELNNNEKIKQPFFTSDVYLGEYNLWKRLWREYFLMNKEIVTLQNLPTEKNNLKGISLVLSEKNYLERDGKKLIYKNIVWENNYYQLGEISPMKKINETQ